MPILIVDQQTDLAGVARRLLKPRASKAAVERTARAIREANPGIDLTRIPPGTVIVVPSLPEPAQPAKGVAEETAGHMAEDLSRRLDATIAAVDAALKTDKSERERMSGLTSSAELQRAADHNEALQHLLTDLRASLDQDDRAARGQSRAVQEAVQSWREHLEALRKLLQPPR